MYRIFHQRSERVLSGRLRKLFQAGYLHRLQQLRDVFVPGGGSLPEAYVLDRRGIDWLFDKHQHQVSARHQSLRRRSGEYLRHEIELSHFILSVRASLARHPDIQFLYPEEYYAQFLPDFPKQNTLSRTVQARVRWYEHREIEGTIPDGQFLLYYPQKAAGTQFRSFAVELCRANETVEPNESKLNTVSFWKDTSILRKFVVYAYAIKSGSFKEDFGMPLSHVLMVTKNQRKVVQMQQAFQRRLAGPPHRISPVYFLFTNMEALAQYDDVLDAPIHDGDGQPFSLCSESPSRKSGEVGRQGGGSEESG
jgi:hypothetical protein